MSFRLRIILMTTALMTILFSIGGTALIHSSFQTSMEKEEQAIVDTNELILRVVQYVGKDSTWISEEELISVIGNLCQQDSIEYLQLMHEAELIYVYEKEDSVSEHINEVLSAVENQVQITYFTADEKDTYLQSSTKFSLNDRTFYLDICRKLTDLYETREEQIRLFQNIFIVLSALGVLLSFLATTFITRHLRRLTKASKEIGAGNLSYRSRIKSSDEVGELAAAFDHMAETLEENILLLKESAEQKEMFMGAFTHELKTPMTSIIGYADLLRAQKLSPRDQEDALEYIFTESKRLENMSLKMLELFVADKKEIVLKACSPAKLVAYTVKHLQNMFAKENIRIEVQAEQGICLLDSDLFETLLINLLDNARKAMEHGGKINVAVKMSENGCILYVVDEGRGIPEEALKHLTEAFYRVDKARARSKGSAGLGLALCEKIADLHHGTLMFDSKEGIGTVVTVFLNGGRYEEEK